MHCFLVLILLSFFQRFWWVLGGQHEAQKGVGGAGGGAGGGAAGGAGGPKKPQRTILKDFMDFERFGIPESMKIYQKTMPKLIDFKRIWVLESIEIY